MRVALIPVKELDQAKARLAPVLGDGVRRELALALYRDVLAAATACPAFDGVAVVSRDREVLAAAGAAGAHGLAEPGGLNEALSSASRALAEGGVERLLVVAADLPLVRPEEIEAVAAAAADVVLVAAADGGTNALALPPARLPFLFGRGSARLHLEAARAAGLRARRLDLPGLALDIDTPEDLELLRAAAGRGERVGAHTLAALSSLGLAPAVQGG